VALGIAVVLSGFSMVAAIRAIFSKAPWSPSDILKPTMPYLGNIFYTLGLGPPTLFEVYRGAEQSPHPTFWFGAVLTCLSLAGAVLASSLCVRAVGTLVRTLREETVDTPEQALAAEVRALIGSVGALYMLWHLLADSFVFDRYILPLLPLCWLLCLAAIPTAWEPLRRWPLIGLLFLGGLLSAAGTHEYLSWNAARARAVHELLQSGIGREQIDAGFEWNGVWRFEDYLRRTGSLYSPGHSWWSGELPYRLSFGPRPGCETYRLYPYWTWPGGGEAAIYVLHCLP
jgi:hypothetical protein